MNSLNHFKTAFISASISERSQLIIRTMGVNEKYSQIVNLLQMIDINTTELNKKMLSTNIHYICLQLTQFPEFVFEF